jgi:hypothetical protein
MSSKTMRQAAPFVAALVVAITLAGCASIAPETHALLKKPVNCSAAHEDIKRLSAAKPDGLKQTMTLVQSVSPGGIVVGLAIDDYANRKRIISGEHGADIDRRVAEIATACGIKLEAPLGTAGETKPAAKSGRPPKHQDVQNADW